MVCLSLIVRYGGLASLHCCTTSFMTSAWKQFFLPDGKHFFADLGRKNTYDHFGVLYCDAMSQNLKLPFIGDVSIFPRERSNRMAGLLGTTLFVGTNHVACIGACRSASGERLRFVAMCACTEAQFNPCCSIRLSVS